MKPHKILTLLFLFFLFSSSYASHVLPDFSGEWYTNATAVTSDSCNKEVYKYTNLEKGVDNAIATELLPAKQRTDCTWRNPVLKLTVQSSPADFVGNIDDWNKITSQKSAHLIELWERNCENTTGSILDSERVTLIPKYICPTNSRYTFDVIRSTLGCDTNPDVCVADVVGRDLKYPGLGWAGHVGLTYAPSSVMEVLNDNVVLHLGDSLKDFRAASKFWGEQYGLPDHPYIDSISASSILGKGAIQAAYDPEYTATSSYQPGGNYTGYIYDNNTHFWNKVVTYHRAIFRCDTFVDYCYLAGANITLPASPLVLPKTTFSSFKNKRYLNPSVDQYAFANPRNYVFGRTAPIQTSLLLQRRLRRLASDESYTKSERTILLWEIAKEYQHDQNKINFYYILDTIGFLHSSSVEGNLIQAYITTPDIKTKIKILSAIVEGVEVSNKKVLMNTDVHTIVMVQNFLKNQLLKERDYRLLKELIYLYPTIIMPQQSLSLISTKLEAISGKYFTDNGKIYPYISTLNANILKIRISLMSQQSQSNLFPKVLTMNHSVNTFASALCVVLQDYPVPTIKPSTRKIIFTYLFQHKKNISSYLKASFDNINICDVNKILTKVRTHT